MATALVSQAIHIPFRNKNAQEVILGFVCLFVLCFRYRRVETEAGVQRSVELREQSFHYLLEAG